MEPPPLVANQTALELRDCSFKYPGANCPLLFRNVNFEMGMRSRLALVGPNGVGKSTLLSMLTGELEPTTGELTQNSRLRIGRYAQHFVDQLPMAATPVEHMRMMFEGGEPGYSDQVRERGRDPRLLTKHQVNTP